MEIISICAMICFQACVFTYFIELLYPMYVSENGICDAYIYVCAISSYLVFTNIPGVCLLLNLLKL